MLFVCHHCGALTDTGTGRCPQCGADLEAAPAEAESEPGLEAEPEPARSRLGWVRWVAAGMLVVFAASVLGRSLLLIPVALVALVILWPQLRWAREAWGGGGEGRLYQRLLVKARGDRELVERLLEHERRAAPGLPRGVLMRRVLESWERDHQ